MKKIKNRSLRLESLEDRMLLAVTAGGEAAATELVAPAETGAEIVVNQLTFGALRRAINNANDGDTITFSVSGTIELGTAVEVWKNVTIDGGGQITLRGSGQDALLDISRSATLSGLTLENGYTSANGWGGVGRVEEGVSLVLNNCNIIGNTAETEANAAGAFYVTGQLYMNNCNVYGNTAVNGGFAFIYGRDNHGAALVDATNCTFYGNTASESGGVIRNMGGTVNLTNCTVVGNKAQDGAIANFEYFNVSGNGSGGYNHEYWISDTTITNSIIAYNEATDQATADIYTDYTKALYGGGALQWDVYGIDDTFTKIKSVNSAVGVKGDYFVAAPTFDAEGNLDFDALDLTIKSDGIAAYAGIGANTVAYTGEGFDDYLTVTTLNDSIDSTDGEVSLREAISYATLGTFEGNPVISFADELADGTINLTNGQLAITSHMRINGNNVTVDANQTDRVLFLKSNNYQFAIDDNYYNCPTHVSDCPVHNFTDYCINVMIDGVNFTGGSATAIAKATGGAGILVLQNANLILENSTVSENTLYLTDDSYSISDGKYTSIGGGGIAGILYAALAFDNVTVADNAIVQTGDRATSIIEKGGGIYIGMRSNFSMNDSKVLRNELTSQAYLNGNHSDWCFGYGYGAGIALDGESAVISTSEVSGNSITGCSIEQYGGGIYYYNLSDSTFGGYGLVLTNSKVTENTVGDHSVENNGFCEGAGIFTSGRALLVNDLIADNLMDAGNASVNMTGYIHGAGVCNAIRYDYFSREMNAPILDMYYCTVTHNTAACINYSAFDTDSANWGGGIATLGGGTVVSIGNTATTNFVGGILFHNYSKNSTTGATTNNDTYVNDDAMFTFCSSLYNTSGVKGATSNYDYLNGNIKWLARYKTFTDEDNKDYTPFSGTGSNSSQALDALSADAPLPLAQYISAYDVRNEPYVRVYGTVQDLGCYEYQPEPTPTFEVTINDYEGSYDGEAHSITVSDTEPGDVVTYSEDGVNYSATVPAYTEPGTYTTYVKVERAGYQDFAGAGTVTINTVTTKINVAVVVSASAAPATEVDVLPSSISTANVGDTLYAQVWILNADGSDAGCTGGYINLDYTTGSLTKGSYTVSSIYASQADYVDDSTAGLVACFGGCSQAGVNDLAVDQWALLGTYSFTASAEGVAEVAAALPTLNGAHIKGLNLSRAGAGNFADNEILFGSASFTVEASGGEQLAAPTITTGTRGIYVSYGANRHNIQWGAVANASGYEVQYSTDGGESWSRTISASGLSAVITGLTYGTDVTYRVRALGTGSYTDSDWSRTKTFNVCPMDIDGNGDISGSDRTLLGKSWMAEEGDEDYQYYADIDGNDEVSGSDRTFMGRNWMKEAGDDDLVYPRALAADAAFAGYEAGDFGVDSDVF